MTAVFVFDLWLRYIKEQKIIVRFQYHDEVAIYTTPDKIENDKIKIKKAIDKVNEVLQLNVTIDCSMDVGINYAQVH